MCLAVLGALCGGAMAAQALPKAQTTLVLGDSLSAEYGLARGTGWVALLEKRLIDQQWPIKVVNGSISGETTSGGLSRLPALLAQHRPQVVVIELGANDAIRGLPLGSTVSNLKALCAAAQQSGAQVLLLGMRLPPNYGKRYTDDFFAAFEAVAKAQRVALLPFFLAGVADRADARDWFQNDGTHPLAKAHPLMLAHVWPQLSPLFFGRQPRT